MSDEQGEVFADNVDVPVNENDVEQVSDDAVTENEENTQEPVEIDYKAEYEKSKQTADAMQKKIDRQRAASSQHNAKIQELNEQLAKLQQVEAPTEPSIDDFETHDEYVNALADFRAEKAVKEKEAKMLADQQQQAMQQKAAEQQKVFNEQEAAYKLENPDYTRSKTELSDHLMTNAPSQMMQDVIYEAAELSGNVPAIIDFFGKEGGVNLPEFDRIASLPPMQAAFEVFKIAQGFDGAKTENVKEKKPLPKPLNKSEGSSKGKKSIGSMSEKEFRKWMNG